MEKIKLSVGKQLFLVNEETSCCYLVTIISIRDNEISVHEIETTDGMEVGLKFDLSAKKGLRLYQITI